MLELGQPLHFYDNDRLGNKILVRMAKKDIILIDNYIDDSVLKILNKRADNVSATIYTAHISENLKLDLQKHNSQYQPIDIKVFKNSHDRFLIIDD